MNEFKLTPNIESKDKYLNAKEKLIEFMAALNKLDKKQSEQLACEFLKSCTVAASFEEFVKYINNGGQV